ncbi:glycosidase [Halanaerobium saccharolyticum]|jgi:glycosidase|uniref:Glycosidase n=1 Tax=Halanaerobium saccharolyticum TaxID=43595 RepID=A0A4R7YRC7_9FIRM|nr:alpha amylase N-terminal ig-like domain-containing protein [Halanaerobium saccharolyticum]RAK05243.1 glycosidase [Halanaerobium saccharolyticum]TDV99608.1 glycosidase [Halanaerobium saccharolyticum]TDX51724.1 glycosidase [Halanaerobium saccharolyticum]
MFKTSILKRSRKYFIRSSFFSIVFIFLVMFSATALAEQVEFKFYPAKVEFEGEVEAVYLAGSFNDWQPADEKMNGPDEDGFYTLKYNLRPGEYQYKFVINGEHWFHDPDNELTTADGHGGKNSILEVGEKDLEKAQVGDGVINAEFVLHDPENRVYLNKLSQDKVQIRLETRKNDVEAVSLLTKINSERAKKEMFYYSSDNKLDYWTIDLDNLNKALDYTFLIEDADSQLVYHKNGNGFDKLEYYSFDPAETAVFKTPGWVQNAIFYQIFPDRFYNGNPDNDPELIETYKNKTERYKNIVPKWHQGIKESESNLIDPDNFTDHDPSIHPKSGWRIFYGGDLQGVKQKFGYLKELGINAIYFNPVFEATSNHRYNTADYGKIDDNLAVKDDFEASEEYFIEFIQNAHQKDIKIVLDAVFNHTGLEFFAFEDVVEKGKTSEYSDWFYIDDYPITTLYEQRTENKEPNYEGWAGYGNHPVLNLDNPEVKDYIYQITEKWMDPDGNGNPDDGIDGWRLDVANDVKARHPEFWREWRNFVKEINSEAYITGEIWNNAAGYLQGDEFDAVMNYRFREAALAFIAEERIDAQSFINRINAPNLDYPTQAIFSLQNLIDSHDTERFLYSSQGNKDKLKMAAALQFTYPGAPMIYYGTEVGLSGASDPDTRRTMIWQKRPNGNQPDQELYEYYSKLASIRKENEVLRTSGVEFETLGSEPKIVIVKRKDKNDEIYTILNAASEEKTLQLVIEDAEQVIELLTEEKYKVDNGQLKLKLDSFSAKILKIK